MEITDRHIVDITIEQLTEEINNEINKHILNRMFEIRHTLGDNKNYDKFRIVTTGNDILPYNIKECIQQQIDKEVEQGYIETKIKDFYGTTLTHHINLDDIHSITYIYDKLWAPDQVIRMHQTEKEYQRNKNILTPIYLPSEMNLANINSISKYYILNN